jgi:hypothetical protein
MIHECKFAFLQGFAATSNGKTVPVLSAAKIFADFPFCPGLAVSRQNQRQKKPLPPAVSI